MSGGGGREGGGASVHGRSSGWTGLTTDAVSEGEAGPLKQSSRQLGGVDAAACASSPGRCWWCCPEGTEDGGGGGEEIQDRQGGRM